MNLYTNLDSYTAYKLSLDEVIRRIESEPDFSRIEGENNKYKVTSLVYLKYPIPISILINVVQKEGKGAVINIYSNLIMPLIIMFLASLLASIVLVSVYDLNSIIPTVVFLPLTILLILDMTNQIKKNMEIKLSSLLNQ